MKFAVTKEALLDGLQRIQNVVSTRSTLPVLTNGPARNVEDSPPPRDDRSGGLRAVRGCRPGGKAGVYNAASPPALCHRALAHRRQSYFAIEEIAQIQEF